MAHATLRSFPHAQLGVLHERPSPARIAAISAVIALHAAALLLLDVASRRVRLFR